MKKVFVILLLLFAVNSYAVTGRVDLSGANGVYYLRASDFSDVVGVEVEVQYDVKTLANPVIVAGSSLASTMYVPNPKFSPSSIKIAAMSLAPIKSGDLATITFKVIGDKAGYVRIVNNPKLVAVTGTKANPSASTGTTGGGTTGGGTTGGGTTGGGTSSGDTITGSTSGGGTSGMTVNLGGGSAGTISLPADQMAATDRKSDYQPLVTDLRKDMSLPLPGAGASSATAADKSAAKDKEPEKKFESFDNVLQLFKAYKGERTAKSLVSLFADAEIPGFTQTPPVAIADGKSPIKISLVLKSAGNEMPKFILLGANVKQLSREGENGAWIVEAVPKKDVFDVMLTVIDGARMIDYPLTVVPKIDTLLTKGKKLSDVDFNLYLAKPPKFDFNSDKKFDAVDDFIYTANYIVDMKIKPEKSAKATAEKSAKSEKDAKSDAKPEAGEKALSDKKDSAAGKEGKKGGKTKGGKTTPKKKSAD